MHNDIFYTHSPLESRKLNPFLDFSKDLRLIIEKDYISYALANSAEKSVEPPYPKDLGKPIPSIVYNCLEKDRNFFKL
jgi:hypothetical protein